jgi:hypothetical protein
MKDHFLFSLRKINFMKYVVVLFCLISTMSFAQRGKKQLSAASQNHVSNNTQSELSDFDQILQFVVNDFSQQLANSGNKPTTVILLDSYTQLVNKRISVNGIQFISGGKPEVLVNNGIVMAFWRLDIKEDTAHIEFYYTDSKNQTTHHEYQLTKENAVWRK